VSRSVCGVGDDDLAAHGLMKQDTATAGTACRTTLATAFAVVELHAAAGVRLVRRLGAEHARDLRDEGEHGDGEY